MEYFDSRSTAMGVGAEGIEVVVLSHLHLDHAGNARMFDTTSATLVRHEREREFALGFDGPPSGTHLKADYEGLELAEFRASVEKLRGIQHRTGATMMFGHDAGQILRLRTAPGASYT